MHSELKNLVINGGGFMGVENFDSNQREEVGEPKKKNVMDRLKDSFEEGNGSFDMIADSDLEELASLQEYQLREMGIPRGPFGSFLISERETLDQNPDDLKEMPRLSITTLSWHMRSEGNQKPARLDIQEEIGTIQNILIRVTSKIKGEKGWEKYYQPQVVISREHAKKF